MLFSYRNEIGAGPGVAKEVLAAALTQLLGPQVTQRTSTGGQPAPLQLFVSGQHLSEGIEPLLWGLFPAPGSAASHRAELEGAGRALCQIMVHGVRVPQTLAPPVAKAVCCPDPGRVPYATTDLGYADKGVFSLVRRLEKLHADQHTASTLAAFRATALPMVTQLVDAGLLRHGVAIGWGSMDDLRTAVCRCATLPTSQTRLRRRSWMPPLSYSLYGKPDAFAHLCTSMLSKL